MGLGLGGAHHLPSQMESDIPLPSSRGEPPGGQARRAEEPRKPLWTVTPVQPRRPGRPSPRAPRAPVWAPRGTSDPARSHAAALSSRAPRPRARCAPSSDSCRAPPRQYAHPRPAPPPPLPAPARPGASQRGRADPPAVGTGGDGTSASPLSSRQPRVPAASGPGGGAARSPGSGRAGGSSCGRLAGAGAAPGAPQPLPQPGAPGSGTRPARIPAGPHGSAPRAAVLLAAPALCALRRRGQPDSRCVRVVGAWGPGARGGEAEHTGAERSFLHLCHRRCPVTSLWDTRCRERPQEGIWEYRACS